MGQLSRHEAADLWIKATDLAQAIITQERTSRRSDDLAEQAAAQKGTDKARTKLAATLKAHTAEEEQG